MIKKSHRKHPKNLTYTRHVLKFGSIGLKVSKSVTLTKEQLISFEKLVFKKIKNLIPGSKNYKFWCLLSVNRTVTKLSLESRMGKGKGAIQTQSVFIKPGCIICELQNVKMQYALELFKFVKKHVPTKLILVKKNI